MPLFCLKQRKKSDLFAKHQKSVAFYFHEDEFKKKSSSGSLYSSRGNKPNRFLTAGGWANSKWRTVRDCHESSARSFRRWSIGVTFGWLLLYFIG